VFFFASALNLEQGNQSGIIELRAKSVQQRKIDQKWGMVIGCLTADFNRQNLVDFLADCTVRNLTGKDIVRTDCVLKEY